MGLFLMLLGTLQTHFRRLFTFWLLLMTAGGAYKLNAGLSLSRRDWSIYPMAQDDSSSAYDRLCHGRVWSFICAIGCQWGRAYGSGMIVGGHDGRGHGGITIHVLHLAQIASLIVLKRGLRQTNIIKKNQV